MKSLDSLRNCLVLCCLLSLGTPTHILYQATPDSETQEDTACTKQFHNTSWKQRDTHVTLRSRSTGKLVSLSVEVGAMYTISEDRPSAGGSELGICESSVLPAGRCRRGRRSATEPSLLQEAGTRHSTAGDSAAQPAPKTKSYFLPTASFQCSLQRATPAGDLHSNSENQTQHIAPRQGPRHTDGTQRLRLLPPTAQAQPTCGQDTTPDTQQYK